MAGRTTAKDKKHSLRVGVHARQENKIYAILAEDKALNKFSQKQLSDMARLYDLGMNDGEIAEALGITRYAAQKWRNINNKPSNGNKYKTQSRLVPVTMCKKCIYRAYDHTMVYCDYASITGHTRLGQGRSAPGTCNQFERESKKDRA